MSEFDEDRMISVRASVIEDGEARIKELEAELQQASEKFAEQNIKDFNRIKELEAELAKWKNRVAWQHCDKHGDIKADYSWGCPDCVDELRRENARLRECLKRLEWVDDSISGHRCPACGWLKYATGQQHGRDCWLGNLLRGENA